VNGEPNLRARKSAASVMDPSTLATQQPAPSRRAPAPPFRLRSGSWRDCNGESGGERRVGGRADYGGERIAEADRLHAGTVGAAECEGRAGAVVGNRGRRGSGEAGKRGSGEAGKRGRNYIGVILRSEGDEGSLRATHSERKVSSPSVLRGREPGP
jgi:hypothetical protein